MIRVLLAEDELPLLRGIKHLIESMNPAFRVVCMALNGKEAVDYLTQHHVDAVFTDINMPILDGTALLQHIAENCPDVSSIVISGYDDFEYARSAMRYGAKNYLLKPIDKQELGALLDRLQAEIGIRSYTQKREFLTRLLFTGAPEEAGAANWNTAGLFYVCAGPHCDSDAGDTPSSEIWGKGQFLPCLCALLAPIGNVWTFWGKNVNEAIVVLEELGAQEQKPLAELARQALLLPESACPITIAVSGPVGRIQDLPRLAGELRRRVSRQGIYGESSVLWRDEDPPPIRISVAEVSRLALTAQKGLWEDFRGAARQIERRLSSGHATQAQVQGILEQAFAILQAETGNGGAQQMPREMEELVASSCDYDSLFTDFLSICGDVFHSVPFDTKNKQGLMVSVESYILDNISHPLTIKGLSQRFGLVAPYLSKLFKDYKGVSPTQYVQSVRMESAKKLLAECPQVLAKDIAASLGYSNALYFSKTFKKNVGLYPSEYRQKHKGQATKPV